MTDYINDGDELRELATQNKQSKRRWVQVERLELVAFADSGFVDGRRGSNRGVFDLASPS